MKPPRDPNLSRRSLLLSGASLLGLASGSGAGEGRELASPRFIQCWGSKGSEPGQFSAPIGIAIDRRNRVYITDWNNSRVQVFTEDGVLETLIPVQEQPGGIALDRHGNLYIAHFKGGKVTVYSPRGSWIREFGREGAGDGELNQPGGLVIARDGSVYVADELNHRVQQFTAEGKFVRKWGKLGAGPGEYGVPGVQPVRTTGPNFIALDRDGFVYTTEGTACRIQKFTPDGRFVAAWGRNDTSPGSLGNGTPNYPGPIALCFDSHDRVWVSSTNHRVQHFTKDGHYLRGLGTDRGTRPGEFQTPHGLALDRKGYLYVVDTHNARIQKFAV